MSQTGRASNASNGRPGNIPLLILTLAITLILFSAKASAASPLSANAPTASPQITDIGHSVMLTANPSGGNVPYSYQWYSSGTSTCTTGSTLILGANAVTYSNSPSASTWYCYSLTDSELPPVTVTSNAVSVTINPPVTAGQATPANPTIDRGQNIVLTSSPGGGTPPYNYLWGTSNSPSCSTFSGIAGAYSATFLASSTVSTYYCYNVTDSAVPANAATSSSASLVNVNNALATPVITNSAGASGILLTATWSNGTAPYTINWYSSTTATCDGTSNVLATTGGINGLSNSITVLPSSPMYYCATVTDSAYKPVTTPFSNVQQVGSSTLISVFITPNAIIAPGDSQTLTISWSGGIAPYVVNVYSGSSNSCSSDTTPAGSSNVPSGFTNTIIVTPPSTTYYCAQVQDATMASISTTSPALITVGLQQLTAPTLTSSNGPSGITITATWSSGTPPYAVNWYSSATATCDATSMPIDAFTGITGTSNSIVVPSSSTLYYCASVSDSSALHPILFSMPLQVGSTALSGLTISPASASITSGETVALTATWSGGTGPYTITWYSGASSASCTTAAAPSSTTPATTNTIVLSPTATTYYCASVTDSGTPTPATISSATTAMVTVTAAVTGTTPPPGDVPANPDGSCPYGYYTDNGYPGYCTPLTTTPTSYQQTCIITGTVTDPASCIISAFPLMMLGLMLSLLIIAIVYLFSKILNYAPLAEWYKRELWETIKTAILVGIIISSIVVLSFIGASLAGTPAVAPGQGGSAIASNLAGFYSTVQTKYLAPQLQASYNAYASLFGLGIGTGLLGAIKIAYWFPIPLFIPWPPFLFFGSLETGAKVEIFGSDLLGAAGAVSYTVTNLVVLPIMIVIQAQYDLFFPIMGIGLGILIPVGIILRAIPLFRNMGGTFIGIGIGIAIIYPALLLIFNLPVSNYFYALTPQTPSFGCAFADATLCDPISSALNIVISNPELVALHYVFGSWVNDGVVDNYTAGFSTGFDTPLSSYGIYPSLNIIIDRTIDPVIQFVLFALDIIAGYILANSIASLLGGRISLGIGNFRLV